MLLSSNLFSQNLYNYSHFTKNSEIFNPSAIMNEDIATFYLTSRLQWAGVDGFPKYNALGGSYNISSKMKLGLSIFNSTHGVFNNLKAKINYAYIAKLSKNQSLVMGFSFGVVNDNIFTNNLQYVNLNDELIQSQNLNRTTLTSAFGITYNIKNLSMQVILPQLIEHNELNLYGISILSYEIKSKRKICYTPYLLVRNTELNKIQTDAVLNVEFKKKFWIQAGARSNGSLTFGFGGNKISYAYETPVNNFTGSTVGSHEVLLKFSIKNDKTCPAYDKF